MLKDLVSIVIPCYNAEKYLNDCLSALLNQTYKKIEVIIVNDGSTDNSEKIIDSYEKKFKKNNMKLLKINQANSGQASAVNNALKFVNGEYLMWQDADDWYELDTVEYLKNYLDDTNSEIVRAEAVFRDANDLNKVLFHARSKYDANNNVFESYLFETDSYCWPGIWMVKMEYFDSRIHDRTIIVSGEGQNAQLIFPLTCKNKVGYLKKVVYNYRVINNSHSHTKRNLSQKIKRNKNFKTLFTKVIYSIDVLSLDEKKKYEKKISNKYNYIIFKDIFLISFFKNCLKQVLRFFCLWKK